MTLEESREVIPMLEEMVIQIEDQQGLMVEIFRELEQRNSQLLRYEEQNQKLKQLNSELQAQLTILPSTEEMLNLLEIQDGKIKELGIENYQWKELAKKLNGENGLLQKQNEELLLLKTE